MIHDNLLIRSVHRWLDEQYYLSLSRADSRILAYLDGDTIEFCCDADNIYVFGPTTSYRATYPRLRVLLLVLSFALYLLCPIFSIYSANVYSMLISGFVCVGLIALDYYSYSQFTSRSQICLTIYDPDFFKQLEMDLKKRGVKRKRIKDARKYFIARNA